MLIKYLSQLQNVFTYPVLGRYSLTAFKTASQDEGFTLTFFPMVSGCSGLGGVDMPSCPPAGAIELSLGVPITGVLPRGVPNPLSGLTTPLGGAAISMSAGLPGTR